jgi:hypothetical protein
MLSKLIKKKNLFSDLYEIDKKTAERYRQLPCPHCGGPMYFSNYMRKPRGEPDDVPEKYFVQFSLCCGTEGCRKRLIPPSCRFLGRKIYWFAVIVCVLTDWQNNNEKITVFDWSIRTGISRHTIKRWLAFFHDTFPTSRIWRRVRGQISACVRHSSLPSSFINYCRVLKSNVKDTLVSSLIILSGGSKIRDG